MKKFTPYIIITSAILIVVFALIKTDSMYMSEIDYFSQHSAYPDYFRKLFYDSKELFPSYAFNIGAGQNIYNFSYYGLLNPIILISYLLPMIEMATYLMIATVILQIIGGILMYRLLLSIGSKYPLVLTLLYVLAVSITFHSHRHWMFVSYIPFLLLALHGIEKYKRDGKSWLYLISIFLILMTSFYFILPCVIVMILYYMYRSDKRIDLKRTAVFVLKMLIPLSMSMVLILPTFFILFSNRQVGGSVEALQMLIPHFDYSGIFYSPYGLGVIGLFGIALIDSILSREKRRRYLGIILLLFLTIPLMQYLLNGTLYIEAKVLIPFLPLFTILVGATLENFRPKRAIPIFFILTLLMCLNPYSITSVQITLVIEFALSLIILYIRYRKKWDKLLYLFAAFALFTCLSANFADNLIEKTTYKELRGDAVRIDEFVRQNNNLVSDSGVASINNANYIPYIGYFTDTVYSSLINQQYVHFQNKTVNSPHSSRNNATFNSTDNIMMETLMGVKYVKTETPSIGYKKYNGQYYYNNNVLPLGYVNRDLVSTKSFEALESIYRSDIMINQVAVDESQRSAKSSIKKQNVDYDIVDRKNIEMKGDTYVAKNSDSFIRMKVNQDLTNKILFLNIKLKYTKWVNKTDQKIWVNNILNTQTGAGWKYDNKNSVNGFNYVISNLKNNELTLYLDKGVYEIDKINGYLLDYDKIKDINTKIDKFHISSIRGDTIKGDIKVTEDGYFVFQVPYDEDYKVFVNDAPQKHEKVNSDFLGFKLKKGTYQIRIEYQAGGLSAGKWISAFGCLMFAVLCLLERRKKYQSK